MNLFPDYSRLSGQSCFIIAVLLLSYSRIETVHTNYRAESIIINVEKGTERHGKAGSLQLMARGCASVHIT